MKIAACLVTYFSPQHEVLAAVESFFAAKLPVALVVVDNSSDIEYFSKLQQALPQQAKIVQSGGNLGFGRANNIGFRHLASLRAEYLLVLNPDVEISPGCLESLAVFLDTHPEVGAVSPRVLNADGSLQPLNKRLPTIFDLFARRFLPKSIQEMPFIRRKMERYMMLDVGYEDICQLQFMTGCFMLVRRDIFEKLGGFDEKFFMYLEDADLTRRINQISTAMYYPHVHITHLWKRGSYNSKRLFLVMLHSIWIYFNKWGWKFW